MRLSHALLIAALLALLIATGPFLSLFSATVVSGLFNCPLNDSGPNLCAPYGFDIGPALYTMVVARWLIIFSLFYFPVSLAFVVAGFIFRSREKKAGGASYRVGLPFWLSMSGALLSPFFGYVMLLPLITAAGLRLWKIYGADKNNNEKV